MTTVRELLERESFFDAAVLKHGFADYMRDYDIIVGARNGPPNTDLHRYQFIGCVEAEYTTKVAPNVFARSLPDDFVLSGPNYPEKEDPDGFIWGTRCSRAYPGLLYVHPSERAQKWSLRLGRPMHEVTLETEAFHLRLVFADARYRFEGSEQAATVRGRDFPVPPHGDPTSDGGVR